MTPSELRQKGYQALVDSLGRADALWFLQQMGRGRGNYTRERESNLQSVTREQFWKDIERIRARKNLDRSRACISSDTRPDPIDPDGKKL